MVKGLIGGIEHPLVPLVLLVFALQTAVTTATCLMDMVSWEGFSMEKKWRLGGLYGGYLGFGECFYLRMILCFAPGVVAGTMERGGERDGRRSWIRDADA